MTELVFSTQRRNFERGRHYQNPKFFDGRFPANTTHVYILGDWPVVSQAAYDQQIPCTVLKEGAPISWKDGIAPVDINKPLVEIPETWQKFGNPRVIALAAEIAGRDVANRKQATRIIEDELERRTPVADSEAENDESSGENDEGEQEEIEPSVKTTRSRRKG